MNDHIVGQGNTSPQKWTTPCTHIFQNWLMRTKKNIYGFESALGCVFFELVFSSKLKNAYQADAHWAWFSNPFRMEIKHGRENQPGYETQTKVVVPFYQRGKSQLLTGAQNCVSFTLNARGSNPFPIFIFLSRKRAGAITLRAYDMLLLESFVNLDLHFVSE